MNTYHIHIGGLVQGVGFRPFVCRIAEKMGLQGWVSNGNDGVHTEINATKETADLFYHELLNNAPANAIIRSHHFQQIPAKNFSGFVICPSDASAKPDLLLTPDIAICEHCKKEITDPSNKRYQYPFTTCLECGPRYSIIQSLPYDRVNTSMVHLAMCDHCETEYNDINNRRHYSQTNSCLQCTIPIHFYDSNAVEICNEFNCIQVMVQKALQDGHIVAVKGIGGYLLLCDAANALAVETLRHRKHRPTKPFAVMYPSIAMMEDDLMITDKEKEALQSKAAPIVLCKLKEKPGSHLCVDVIVNGLDKLGAILPYSPLLHLIMEQWAKPLIATSGNLSGSPIVYTDDDALLLLTEYADFIVSFERAIVAPQDDSVVQFTQYHQHPIIIRRSRGMAPNYYPSPFRQDKNILAMGAELKSAFAIQAYNNLYVSQFLGDQGNYESQVSYKNTLAHLLGMLKVKPEKILVDSHPYYFVSQKGNELHQSWDVPITAIQHHKAHFAAVLAENNLLHKNELVLGVVWDGTGYGDDEQVWGGEFFLKQEDEIERYMHLDYFPQLLGDKMSKEPRVSAVSLLRNNMDHLMMIKDLFSAAEREYYLKLLQQSQHLLTSSMGRLLDGIAAILKIQSFNTYEGEAAMKLEVMARSCTDHSFDYYPIPVNKNRLEWSAMIEGIMRDVKGNVAVTFIAKKVFISLVMLIRNVALRSGTKKIAFSGGVFQNAFLVDLIIELLRNEFELFFHQQLSPNDECIGFGQIAAAALMDSCNVAFRVQWDCNKKADQLVRVN
jgi:hydrogenase maturation protein HypF